MLDQRRSNLNSKKSQNQIKKKTKSKKSRRQKNLKENQVEDVK